MRNLVQIVDEFCPQLEQVRQSALASGFGTWRPNKGEIGSSIYDGMSFWGNHAYMIASLTQAMGTPIFPNSMFFRVTNEETEKAYVHSDRESGAKTCVAYLSEHETVSGTGFFRHRKSGRIEMPSFAEMREDGSMQSLGSEMVEGDEKDWEQIDFVRGLFNRAVIFHAPLFHARCPKNGIGQDSASGRMVWVCHFHTAQTLAQLINEEQSNG